MEIVPITEGVVEPERISPEGLEVANTYLTTNCVKTTARELGVSVETVTEQLNSKLVRRYIDTVFLDTGYRNRAKLGAALDAVIERKMEEMEEAEISSTKDISDLLAQAHKFRMDELKMQMEMMKLQHKLESKPEVIHTGPTVNIQDNSMGGSNYGQLMTQLLNLEKKPK